MTALRHYRWALVWALFILLLCLIPGYDLPKWKWAELFSVDKLVHAGVFAVLVILLVRAVRSHHGEVDLRSRGILLWIGACIAYGGALEIMQGTFFIQRTADLLDFIANGTGCLLGWWWLQRRERQVSGGK